MKLYLYVLTCHLSLNVSSQISCTTVSVFYLFTNTFRAWDGLDKKSYFVDIDFTLHVCSTLVLSVIFTWAGRIARIIHIVTTDGSFMF